MQPPDSYSVFAFVDEADLPSAASRLEKWRLEKWVGSVACFIGLPVWEVPATLGRELTVRRFFDRYYALLSRKDDVRAQRVIDALFATIAADYDRLIDRERNLENIGLLIKHVALYSSPRAERITLVDIGCGTGLAQELANGAGVQLIGVDRSPEMRAIAKSRGMNVVDPQELTHISLSTLDGAFASYVFHLGIDAELLSEIWKRLRLGAALSANFHKGIAVDAVAEILGNWGAEVRMGEPHSEHSEHGSYATFVKVLP